MALKDNPVIQCILSRRSIRHYTDDPVTDEAADLMVRCAMAAPSACNCRPVHIIQVTDREKLDKLAQVHPFEKMAGRSPLTFVICAETDRSPISSLYWGDDAAAAIENLLLAAHALGYGAVWCGARLCCEGAQEKMAELRELFGVPEHIEMVAYVTVGKPKDVKEGYWDYDAAAFHKETW